MGALLPAEQNSVIDVFDISVSPFLAEALVFTCEMNHLSPICFHLGENRNIWDSAAPFLARSCYFRDTTASHLPHYRYCLLASTWPLLPCQGLPAALLCSSELLQWKTKLSDAPDPQDLVGIVSCLGQEPLSC